MTEVIKASSDLAGPADLPRPATEAAFRMLAAGASCLAYHPSMVIGQLQTEAYARALMSTAFVEPIPRRSQDALWSWRRRIQARLHPGMRFVLGEAALHYTLGAPDGAAVIGLQRSRLFDLAGCVEISVLPFGAGAPGMFEAFMVLDGPPSTGVPEGGAVHREEPHRDSITYATHQPELVAAYRDAWHGLREASVPLADFRF